MGCHPHVYAAAADVLSFTRPEASRPLAMSIFMVELYFSGAALARAIPCLVLQISAQRLAFQKLLDRCSRSGLPEMPPKTTRDFDNGPALKFKSQGQ